MLEWPEIAYVDRPPKINLEISLQKDLKEFKVDGEPSENAAGILVVDSGILAGHPLLENAVADEIASATTNGEIIHGGNPSDDVGHGTQVAGIALYGDIEKCIVDGVFRPEIWIFSAKVMFKGEDGCARYIENDLLEKQLFSAVKAILEQYPNCKVINLSFGNSTKKMYRERRQYPLASLIDELCKNFGAIFVISAGNNEEDIDDPENYPRYLMDDSSDRAKIIDPASSALALTVGSLCKFKIPSSGEVVLYPSPITRVGPGYKGMIKPEFIEIGGDGFGRESKIIALNPNWIGEGRLFTLVSGTSFSAPRISHYAATLFNAYPNYTSNLIKALLINSASIPKDRPIPLSEINIDDVSYKAINLLNIYGYGKPNIEKALKSESNRVILIRENKIKLKKFHIYPVYLPIEFIEERGEKKLSVTLVHDPPVNRNRTDYLGTVLEFHLYKDSTINEVISEYKQMEEEESLMKSEEEKVPSKLKGREILLYPGPDIRKKGVHQKGTITFKRRNIDITKPLILLVYCLDRWIRDDNYIQDYAVLISIEHSQRIDIYNQLRIRNQERIEIMQKI